MRDYNKVILMGNFAQDPEYKEISNNRKVTNFVIATNRTWTGPEGQDASEVSFIDCAIYGERAKTISNHFSKGRPIFLEGRLKQEKWEKDGKKQSRLRVIVENFNFIDSKKSSEENSHAEETIPAAAGNDVSTTNDFDEID